MALQPSAGYLRSPSIGGDTVLFVTEDDLWSVSTAGGPARRITADLLRVADPVVSPDARMVAFTSDAQGQAELYVVPVSGGAARRLTWLGGGGSPGQSASTKALSWADGKVVFASNAGQPFASLTMAYTVSEEGEQPPAALPYGPVRNASYGPGGGVVIGRNTGDPALWKRYRGGTAGAIWLDRHGRGDFQLLLRPEAVGGNLAAPMWVGDRIFFLSDHEGIGNLYSCSLDGDDIRRHTDHDEHYARSAATDGRRIVYQMAARLWIYDPSTDRSHEVPVEVGSPRTQRQPRFVPAQRYLTDFRLDQSGQRLVLNTRGKLFSFAPFDGPVVQYGERQGVRYRLSSFLGTGHDIVTVSDASGFDAIEVYRTSSGTAGTADGSEDGTSDALDLPGVGRVLELAPSPDGSLIAITNHKFQLFVVDVATGEQKLADESAFGPIEGPSWSPDGKWVAYGYRASAKTSQVKLGDVSAGTTFAVTRAQFRDGRPSFDPTGSYLYFLSRRTFNPVYDSLFFDLGFPLGARPYLVTLRSGAPSPFVVRPQPDDPTAPATTGRDNGAAQRPDGSEPEVAVRVDFDGIEERVVEVPVPEARYEAIFALKNKLLLLSRPITGALDRNWFDSSPPTTGVLESYDLVEDRRETLLSAVGDVVVSGDRKHVAYTTAGPDPSAGLRLRIVGSASKPDEERAKEPPGRRSGFVDLHRVRPLVDPGAEWAQMLREAWRLQLDHFWTPDLSGVDWQAVLDRYLPLVDRVSTRLELSDLIWELQGELGTSHSYEVGGEYRKAPPWGLAHLGANFAKDSSGRWVVVGVARGSSWHPKESSPLLTPGAGVEPGTAILAVNGQAVDPVRGLGPLLANQAGLPVELTVSGPVEAGPTTGPTTGATTGRTTGPAPGQTTGPTAGPRTVVVPTLSDDRPLRYRDWVNSNRERVLDATAGRAGYIHIPDMGPFGWSEFHRSFLAEVERDALVVDVRFNGGGHVSGLILEKLARRRLGWDVPRRGAPVSYPQESPVGPMVAITNEYAGSDGDIFTHGFKMLRLGPVVGTRTWGGVIGIDIRQPLVDGSITTQPEYAFWFDDVGWAVENHGAEPDEEVLIYPEDYAAGRDPQLERAVQLVVTALNEYEPAWPELDKRPQKALPVLPGRR